MSRININEYDTIEDSKYNGNISMPRINEPVPRFIEDVLSKYLKRKINLQPEFQRQFVWNRKKQKELIKSLYSGIPLPMFYFAESIRDIDEVVDGQQRLTTMFGFLKPKRINKKLRGKIIQKVKIKQNGKHISLNKIKKEIGLRKIYCVYLPKTSVNFKYEIFRVLNQGATMLKAQEIRNCLLASEKPEFNKLLKDMGKKLRKITGMSFDRMLGEELALRFFVINRYGYEKDITNIMNNLSTIKKDFNKDEIKRMRRKSQFFIKTLKKIFGKDVGDCFQVLKKGLKPPKNNKWRLHIFSGKINQSLFQLLSFYILKYSNYQLNRKKFSKIKKGYLKLLKNKGFVSVITGAGTNSTRNIQKSKQIFKKVFLDKYLGDWAIKHRRNISSAEKRTIFRNIPYCYLCYKKFRKSKSFKKTHAEHIGPYSSGKQSKLSNILLAHPECNSEKKDMSLEQYRQTKSSIKRRKGNKKNIGEYLKALKEWNSEYKLDMYRKLVRFAKTDRHL